MNKTDLLKNYRPLLNLVDTEKAIKLVKDTFERKLAKNLNLTRVSAPLFVDPKTGLNDDLTGKERPVRFQTENRGFSLEIVQSLAKWKRSALKRYAFPCGKGLYTDMNAIRPSEILDNLHSFYVDQWDWEKIIRKDDRNIDFLKKTVTKIYHALLATESILRKKYPVLAHDLPDDVHFITAAELQTLYPHLSARERENIAAKTWGVCFLIGIGWPLADGKAHDLRAADYDDWNLNGDLLLWYEPLGCALELSSMGIRVDKDALLKQLKYKGEEDKLNNPYVTAVLKEKLPYTIGGGIGQSRMCMYMLKKVHIGEVQSSFWPQAEVSFCAKHNIKLL